MGWRQATERPGWPRWPRLEQFGTDLSRSLAQSGDSPPAVPRPDVLNRLAAVLSRQSGANAALVGRPGSGRRTSVHALAWALAHGQAPRSLAERQCYVIEASRLVIGTHYRGELEDRLERLGQEVADGAGRLVVALLGAPGLLQGEASTAAGGAGLGRLLRGGGWILVVSPDELSHLVRQVPAWESLVQTVAVDDWDDRSAAKALESRLPGLAAHHGVTFSSDVAELSVALARRYLWARALPGAAIGLVDQASALARVVDTQRVDRPELLQAIADMTGLPLHGLTQAGPGANADDDSSSHRWASIESVLERRVVGQHQAVHAVAAALRRARAGLSDPRRPLGSLLFIGPTGVGKTELARALADFLFGDDEALVRVDMSEYMERHAVARLIGAPPGYVGFELPGQLTDPVRRQPFSIVLLDEIEKAHADVLNLLLQVLEDGRLTDGHGRTVYFRHSVVIMTSNVGSMEARDVPDQGPETWRTLAWRLLRPELLNRLDDIIAFSPLTPEVMEQVVDIQLRRAMPRLQPWHVRVRLAPTARRALATRGFQPELGARPLRRLVEHEVLDPLAAALLAGHIRSGNQVDVDATLNGFVWKTTTSEEIGGEMESHGTLVC